MIPYGRQSISQEDLDAVEEVLADLRARLPAADAPIRSKAEGSAGLDAFRAAERGR